MGVVSAVWLGNGSVGVAVCILDGNTMLDKGASKLTKVTGQPVGCLFVDSACCISAELKVQANR